MSFEDFALTCTRTFGQTPIRLIRMSSPLTAYAGSLDQPYRHLVLLCQPHFTSKTISIAFYLNGTAYFEYLNEDRIRQRLQVLNNSRKISFRRDDLQSVIIRLKNILSIDGIKSTTKNELHAKLLSSRLLSIEINQDDFKFKFRCDERSELFEQHYVRQLLIQVKELSQRQNYLCDLLKNKDQFRQFDVNLFLSTPMTLIENDESEDDDDDTLSSSTTGSLWKAAFSRRGGTQFLDICLLQKSYMKALEDMSDDEQETETETISSILNDLIDRIDDDDDDLGLAKRIGKRSLTASTVSLENESQQLKRLRSNAFV
jgi:hypothetical protein